MNLYLQMLLPVTGGFLLDLALGDPVWPYHPVRLMGRLIERLEPIIRRSLPGTKPFERLPGVLEICLPVGESEITVQLV